MQLSFLGGHFILNIWNKLGFSENIFFVKPLEVGPDIERYFIGRSSESDEFISDCMSDNRCLKIISGDVGTGKTSFVNACQNYFYEEQDERRLLPSFRKIEISNKDDNNSFVRKACNIIAMNISMHYQNIDTSVPENFKPYIDYWFQVKVKTSEGGKSFGASALGSGLQGGHTSKSYSVQEMQDPLYAFNFMLNEFLESAKFSGIFLVIDNLDIVDENIMIDILNNVRDTCLGQQNIYWILIGLRGLSSVISEKSQRLSSYVTGTELWLDNFSNKTVEEIIEQRAIKLELEDKTALSRLRAEARNKMKRLSGDHSRFQEFKVRPPLNYETVTTVYEFTQYDLRETFRICTHITKKAFADDVLMPGILLEFDYARNYFYDFIQDEYKNYNVNEKHLELLSRIYLNGKAVQTSNYSLYGYKRPQGFAMALKPLRDKRLLVVDENAHDTTYRISSRTEALAILGKLGEAAKKVSFRFEVY